jgi:futalosine hydrolase
MSPQLSSRSHRTTTLGSPTLVLVPTELELEHLRELGGFATGSCISFVCGFGPIAASASAARLLSCLRPARIVLLGIAGTYDASRCAVGEAAEFDEVAIDGIGAGESARRVGPRELGLPQWAGSARVEPIFDRLALDSNRSARHQSATLLSVCSVSDSREMARDRRERFPGAVAEDMEGFGVALACAQAGVPLRVVRGMSNEAGDRDHSRWRVRAALAAARELALSTSCSEPPASARS